MVSKLENVEKLIFPIHSIGHFVYKKIHEHSVKENYTQHY